MFASSASNTASNKDANASNGSGLRRVPSGVSEVELTGRSVAAERKKAGDLKRQNHQRWSRKSYNAYQRLYMQTVRAVRAGNAELIRNRPEGIVA